MATANKNSTKKKATKAATAKSTVKKAGAKAVPKKTTPKKAVTKKAAPKTAKKAAKKAVVKKAVVKKAVVKKAAPQKAVGKKAVAPKKVVQATPARPAQTTNKKIPRVSHPSLTAKQKKTLKEFLIAERDRILSFIGELDAKSISQGNGDGERSRSSYSIHQADYASDNQSLNLALAQRQIESARLEEIEWALKRIDAKTYGKCRRCSANIGFDRMQAKPYAEYCIVCRTEMDPVG